MNKKYSLTKNTKEWSGKTLFQIKAEISFKSVVKGELGGYIEKEENLSQDGDAWRSHVLELLVQISHSRHSCSYNRTVHHHQVFFVG